MGRDTKKVSREVRRSENIRKSYSTKRKNVFNPKTAKRDESVRSTSSKKLKQNTENDVPKSCTTEFRIINFITVFTAISALVKCKKCDGKIDSVNKGRIKKFIGILLIMGIVHVPEIRLYWSTNDMYTNLKIKKSMKRDF